MPVEFHCEHCGKVIKAPNEAAGKKGKCPACHNICYIPTPPEEIEELPLAPLDDGEERRRQKALEETAKLQYTLLHEKAAPGEAGGRPVAGAARPGARHEPPPLGMPMAEVQQLVAAYVSAMSESQLDRAERVAARLEAERDQVLAVIEKISSGETTSVAMPTMPRPVMLGFLKQLRGRL